MKAKRIKKLDPAGPLDENAARLVRRRLDELVSFAPKALDRDRLKAQHDMRIAAKRLRYVLEVTGFCFGDPAESARRRARELQDILGEMHDCDVMLPRIERHQAALGSDDFGLRLLANDLRERRERLFERFTRFWAEQEEAETWLRLRRAAEEARRRAKAGRPAPPPAA
jgi:CHAD domain-containing protein